MKYIEIEDGKMKLKESIVIIFSFIFAIVVGGYWYQNY